MKIAIDAEPANRSGATGVEKVTLRIIEQFIKIDGGSSERQYFLFTKDSLRTDFPKLPENFHHRKLSWPFKYFWPHLRLPLGLIKLWPDVTFIPGSIVSPFTPHPVVTIVHDIGAIERPDLYRRKNRISQTFAFWAAVKNSKVIITPTKTVAGSIKKVYPKVKAKIVPIYWGLDKEIINLEKTAIDSEILNRYNLKKGEYFIYVGRLEAKKNTQRLIEAFRQIKSENNNLQMVLVGPDNPFIDSTGCLMIGYQNANTISALYRNAKALVFPSEYEGFGLPVLEALACSSQAVISDLPVFREIAGDKAIYIDPESVQSIIEGMKKALSNSENLQKDEIRVWVKEFTWEKAGRQILEQIVSTTK